MQVSLEQASQYVLNNEININHFSNNAYIENDAISEKQKTSLDKTLAKLNYQLELYKKDTNINHLDKENLINFNDWLEKSTLSPILYSKGENKFESYWWGFKTWITWDKLKEYGDNALTVSGLYTSFKEILPKIGGSLPAIAILASIGAVQVGGCLLGRTI